MSLLSLKLAFLTCLTDVPQVSFKKGRVIAPLYTGGPVSVSHDGRMLATCVGEEAILTDLEEGRQIARFAGVRSVRSSRSFLTN